MSNRTIVRLKGTEQIFRQIFGDRDVYSVPDFSDCLEYDDERKLEEQQWFKVDNFTSQDYCPEYLKEPLQTVYDNINSDEFPYIDYLFGTLNDEQVLWFLHVTAGKYIKRTLLQFFNGEPDLVENDRKLLELANEPHAYFVRQSNTLYFKNLSSITSIFKGIEILFREATDEEVIEFVNSPVVTLGAGYVTDMIKTQNRKRLKAAKEKYDSFTPEQKEVLNDYLRDYCPDLARGDDGSYVVNRESELAMLLNGINQRYYTTPIDNERRLANSVSVLGR